MTGYRHIMMIALALAVGITGSAVAQAPPVVTVNYAAGESLAQAVQAAVPGTGLQGPVSLPMAVPCMNSSALAAWHCPAPRRNLTDSSIRLEPGQSRKTRRP